MRTATSSRGQAVREAVEALSSRHDEPAWLRQRRLDAWRLSQELPTDDEAPRLEALLQAVPRPQGKEASSHVWQGDYGGSIRQQGPEVASRWLNPQLAAQGMIFSDLHSAAREHPGLMRRHLMSVLPPEEGGDEALNSALWSGGVLLYVPADLIAEQPLQYLIGGSGAEVIFPRILLIAERGSSATFVDVGSSGGKGPAVTDSITEIVLAQGARIRYIMLEDWARSTDCRVALRAVLNEGSCLELMVVGTGGARTRARLEAVLTAPGATARVVALALADGDQRFEYSTLQEHQAPETVSDLLFKSALRGRSRLQWRGLTRVRRDAAGADANQESRSLLLGERAQARPMPVLEIEAHDVSRCSHGATVSSLDGEQLFYLMSRGLSRGEAETAIVEGFFRQGLDRLDGDAPRVGVERVLRRKLAGGPARRQGPARGMQ